MRIVKRLLFLTGVIIIGGIAAMIIAERVRAPYAPSQAGMVAEADLAQARSEPPSAAAPPTPDLVPPDATAPPENSPQLIPANGTEQTNSAPQQAVAQASQGRTSTKEPLRDPVARVALALVGADAEAEMYWYEAINDPTLPPNERQDLIEDLNEDGLSDPKHPTAEDLPLIFSRLLIIEAVGPDSMDKVNADAFQEAYKDLVNLADLAMGSGESVK